MASIDLTDDQEAKDAIKAGATRLEFEGAKDLHYGLVQKTVRPYGKVMMAKVNPPDDSWVEFKTAEMCAKAARAMDASRFEPGQDGVEGSKGQWFATFKEGEPVPDPYAKKQDAPDPGRRAKRIAAAAPLPPNAAAADRLHTRDAAAPLPPNAAAAVLLPLTAAAAVLHPLTAAADVHLLNLVRGPETGAAAVRILAQSPARKTAADRAAGAIPAVGTEAETGAGIEAAVARALRPKRNSSRVLKNKVSEIISRMEPSGLRAQFQKTF
eukprot:CAMPEP_0172590054 /NCGR_PEP_ID=MMETSP1068-20121228/8528_1 /TAXON_ID=35684 /ORGANISM="Pseudopedinella elastica, Strain CCMP716" /LENGTH=267 /DNA_ID=CAMNT_0013385741 /DNA_START=17 /DNA_END=821 /DNA_ORIENTATION=+